MSQLSLLDRASSSEPVAAAVVAPGDETAMARPLRVDALLQAVAAVEASGALRGRRAVHRDAAARVRAHRAKQSRLDVLIKPEIADTLSSIAGDLDCSKNELLNSMIRFALTNRNWRQVGLYGARKAA